MPCYADPGYLICEACGSSAVPGAESQGRYPIHGTVDAGGAPVVNVSVSIRPENHSLEDSPFARQPQGCSGEDTVTALG